jgi:hypothetical protein
VGIWSKWLLQQNSFPSMHDDSLQTWIRVYGDLHQQIHLQEHFIHLEYLFIETMVIFIITLRD